MSNERWNPGAAAERRQLLFLAVGAAAIAALFAWRGGRVFPAVLGSAAAVAAGGALAHRWIGRDVYLIFALAAGVIGRVVSLVIVGFTYLLAIAGFGSLLRAARVNRLNRDFEACRRKDTMLTEAPLSDEESFRRQS